MTLPLAQWVEAARTVAPNKWSVTHHLENNVDVFVFFPPLTVPKQAISIRVTTAQHASIDTPEAARALLKGRLLIAGVPVHEPFDLPSPKDVAEIESLIRALAEDGGCPACWVDDTDDRVPERVAELMRGPRGMVDVYGRADRMFPKGWRTFWQILGSARSPDFLRLIAVGPGEQNVLAADIPWGEHLRLMPAYWARMALSVAAGTVFG